MTVSPSFACPRCGAVSHHPDDAANRYCGRCHVFLADMLRFRLWVGGKLADERWSVTGEEAERAAAAHAMIARDCDRDGKRWLVEVFDPEQPEDRAYMRFGTDGAGMVLPQEVERWPWER